MLNSHLTVHNNYFLRDYKAWVTLYCHIHTLWSCFPVMSQKRKRTCTKGSKEFNPRAVIVSICLLRTELSLNWTVRALLQLDVCNHESNDFVGQFMFAYPYADKDCYLKARMEAYKAEEQKMQQTASCWTFPTVTESSLKSNGLSSV